MGVELFHLIANGAGPMSKRSPRSLCYKRFPQVRRRIFERRELAFLFLTLSDHFYAPSVAYERTFPIFCRSRCNHKTPTQLIRYAATAVFSTNTIRRKPFFIRSPMALKFLIALCEVPRTASAPKFSTWPRLSPANGLQVAQYQAASSCKTMWCASTRAWQLLLAAPQASNWRVGRQREFLYAPFLQASN
jgi:hypothetical protein